MPMPDAAETLPPESSCTRMSGFYCCEAPGCNGGPGGFTGMGNGIVIWLGPCMATPTFICRTKARPAWFSMIFTAEPLKVWGRHGGR